MSKTALRTALTLAVATAALAPTMAHAQITKGPQTVRGTKPAVEIKAGQLGKVLATPSKFGIYYWNVEKKARGKIKCTGGCAVVWPPVYVKGTVKKHVKGVMATFGTVKRGQKRQLTVNGLPAYTYHNDRPSVVLCDNVDGWFAVRPN